MERMGGGAEGLGREREREIKREGGRELLKRVLAPAAPTIAEFLQEAAAALAPVAPE